MITVTIAGESRENSNASESWITQSIVRRRRDNVPVCVKVSINLTGLNMLLSTPECTSGGGGGRAPNQNEREVFDLWNSLGLNNLDFPPGAVVAFLKRFRHIAAA